LFPSAVRAPPPLAVAPSASSSKNTPSNDSVVNRKRSAKVVSTIVDSAANDTSSGGATPTLPAKVPRHSTRSSSKQNQQQVIESTITTSIDLTESGAGVGNNDSQSTSTSTNESPAIETTSDESATRESDTDNKHKTSESKTVTPKRESTRITRSKTKPSTEKQTETETENNEELLDNNNDDNIAATNSSANDHKNNHEGKSELNQNGESKINKRDRKKSKHSSLAIAASTLAPTTSTGARSNASSPGQEPSRSSSTSASASGASTPSAPAAAYSQEALRDLVCSTLAPAAAANLIKSDKREEKKRKSQTAESPAVVEVIQSSVVALDPAEPQPGPSGLQQSRSSTNSVLAAPDLQLDCLSSDSESDSSSDEDIKIVKISRKKGKSLAKLMPVEVDLTVENTTDDEITVEEVTTSSIATSTIKSSKSSTTIQDNTAGDVDEVNVITPPTNSTASFLDNEITLTPVISLAPSTSRTQSIDITDSGGSSGGGSSRRHSRPYQSMLDHHYATIGQGGAGVDGNGHPHPDSILPHETVQIDTGFRPRRLRHPNNHGHPHGGHHQWGPSDLYQCYHNHGNGAGPSSSSSYHGGASLHGSLECPCPMSAGGQHHSQQHEPLPPSGHHSMMHINPPPPAHRSSSSATLTPPTAHNQPGTDHHQHHRLIRAVARMHPRHQRQWMIQRNRAEQMRYQMIMPRSASSSNAPVAGSSSMQAMPPTMVHEDQPELVVHREPAPSTSATIAQILDDNAALHINHPPPQLTQQQQQPPPYPGLSIMRCTSNGAGSSGTSQGHYSQIPMAHQNSHRRNGNNGNSSNDSNNGMLPTLTIPRLPTIMGHQRVRTSVVQEPVMLPPPPAHIHQPQTPQRQYHQEQTWRYRRCPVGGMPPGAGPQPPPPRGFNAGPPMPDEVCF
jgi:hypothetical protein